MGENTSMSMLIRNYLAQKKVIYWQMIIHLEVNYVSKRCLKLIYLLILSDLLYKIVQSKSNQPCHGVSRKL